MPKFDRSQYQQYKHLTKCIILSGEIAGGYLYIHMYVYV